MYRSVPPVAVERARMRVSIWNFTVAGLLNGLRDRRYDSCYKIVKTKLRFMHLDFI